MWCDGLFQTSAIAGSLSDDRASSDHAVIIDDATVDAAAGLHSHVLADVHRACNTVRQSVRSINRSTVANRGEVTNTDGIQFGSDSNIVPDSGPLAHVNVSNKRGIGSDPCVFDLRHGIIQRHLLSVS